MPNLRSHIFYPSNLKAVGDMHGEMFHMDVTKLEKIAMQVDPQHDGENLLECSCVIYRRQSTRNLPETHISVCLMDYDVYVSYYPRNLILSKFLYL